VSFSVIFRDAWSHRCNFTRGGTDESIKAMRRLHNVLLHQHIDGAIRACNYYELQQHHRWAGVPSLQIHKAATITGQWEWDAKLQDAFCIASDKAISDNRATAAVEVTKSRLRSLAVHAHQTFIDSEHTHDAQISPIIKHTLSDSPFLSLGFGTRFSSNRLIAAAAVLSADSDLNAI